MEIEIRLEEERDYRAVEEITREAFWNLYVPGANEHFLVHSLRNLEIAIPKLNFVALVNKKVVGYIFYTAAKIVDSEGVEHPVLTFGPLSVAPGYQRKGIGRALIEFSKKIAAELGYRAIVIYGYPAYYNRVGFKSAASFGIAREDGVYAKALLAMELYEGALEGITGNFCENIGSFQVTAEELERFDSTFLPKEKKHEPSQDEFMAMVDAEEDPKNIKRGCTALCVNF